MAIALSLLGRFWPHILAGTAGAWTGYYIGHLAGHRSGVTDGRAAYHAEQVLDAARRKEKSDEAQIDVDRCLSSATCRMSDDGHKRPD